MHLRKIDFNAPVILTISGLSLVVLMLNSVTGGWLNLFLAARYTSWLDPMQYIRMFTHVLAHSSLSHYSGNFLLILAVGPLVEERYGSARLLFMFAATALVTGLVNILFFRGVALVGASGLVFMLILLASFANLRENKIPLTVILVALLYLGNEVISWITVADNISRLSHILGGLCGAGFGVMFNRDAIGRGR